MEIRTVLLIFLAVLAASVIVFYQYFYKNNRTGQFYKILAALRFCTLLSAFLLLVNPKFTKNEYFLEKANLVLLLDNSSSLDETGIREQYESKVQEFLTNGDLLERFQLEQYTFDARLKESDSLRLDGSNTNISDALAKVDEIYASGTNAVILFTDGNQTLGKDYEFLDLDSNVMVHPVVVGDTTQYEDIAVGLVNSNTYAFLRNKFPIEATIRYSGNKPVVKTVTVSLDGKIKFRERMEFDASNNSKTLDVVLEAESVGIKNITVEVESLPSEKNRFNNRKEIAIEVIDEKTTIAIVSELLHPDIGALKKSIEANEQRQVLLKKPNEILNSTEDIDLFILYQPTGRFRSIYEYIQKSGTNTLTITGTKTNWAFLNNIQQSFFKESFNQVEEIIPVLNQAFNAYGLGEFSLDDHPPLLGNLGDIELKKNHDVLINQRIRGVDLNKPLVAVFKEGPQKEAAIFGENIWRWRTQAYRNSQSFASFDEFMAKLMVYLTTDNRRSRLELDYKLIYESSHDAKIRAYSFDESYSFDSNSNIVFSCKSISSDFSRELPMLLKGNYFEVDLSDFSAGEYTFTVTKQGENLQRSGRFKIMEFNPEKLSISADYQKLQRLANKSGGELYYMDNVSPLADKLASSTQFTPIQKSRQNVVSLIDFRLLLGLMALTLALEWFLRKYNGLI